MSNKKFFIEVDHWGYNSEEEKRNFFLRHSPNNSGIWKNIELTFDYSGAQYIVCFDSSCRDHRINNKKVIQIRQEPDIIQKYKKCKFSDINIDYSCNSGENQYTSGMFWFIDKSFDILNDLSYDKTKPFKINECSSIFSSKYSFRNDFFRKLSNKTNIVHFFGRNISDIIPNSMYNGPIRTQCKILGLESYKKSIAVENSSQNQYFTEKLTDCFITNTMPIYHGCPNILNFFPSESIRIINLNDIDSCLEAIMKPLDNIEIEAMAESKYLCMYKYNFYEQLYRAINEKY